MSWIIKADGFNKSQSAYQLLVATSSNKLNENDADIWNSDKVESNKSAFVKFQGKPLKALRTYYWKVKIWDESNQESNWSDVKEFKKGISERGVYSELTPTSE